MFHFHCILQMHLHLLIFIVPLALKKQNQNQTSLTNQAKIALGLWPWRTKHYKQSSLNEIMITYVNARTTPNYTSSIIVWLFQIRNIAAAFKHIRPGSQHLIPHLFLHWICVLSCAKKALNTQIYSLYVGQSFDQKWCDQCCLRVSVWTVSIIERKISVLRNRPF